MRRLGSGSFTSVGSREQITEIRLTNQRSVRPGVFGQILDTKRSTSMVVEFFKDLKIYGDTGGGKASRL